MTGSSSGTRTSTSRSGSRSRASTTSSSAPPGSATPRRGHSASSTAIRCSRSGSPRCAATSRSTTAASLPSRRRCSGSRAMADGRPAVYIPNLNAEALLPRTLESLRGQTRPVDIVLVDNGSTDGSVALTRERFEEVTVLELGENLGFGPAINRAVRERPADPVILLNNDIECEPGLIEAMLEAHNDGASVAAVLVQERDPMLIDSAGVVADSTLMGFDYLHGEPVASAVAAPDPLGPTG